MKLILKIALGVYLGATSAYFTVDTWRTRQEQAAKALAMKEMQERDARIQALFKQATKAQGTTPGRPPPGFVPDDDDSAAAPNP